MSTVGRRRQTNLNLPPRMHLKDGIYYHVSSLAPRKWSKLDKDLSKARILWAQIEAGPVNTSSFNVMLDNYLLSNKFMALTENTRKAYEYVAVELRKFFSGASVEDIKPTHVALWMDKHKSAIRANTGKSIIGQIMDTAVRHGLIDTNPAKAIKYHIVKGRTRILTDAEYRSIWALAEDHVKLAMDLGYLTGSRIQDILDIKLQDISAEGLYVKQGKTGKRLLFVMSPALSDVIARAKALPRPVRGMNLICNRRGQAYTYATFNRHWLVSVRAAGVVGLHFHDLRGKAATDAAALGLDYQKLLGHTTKAMSDRYVKVRKIDRVETLPATMSG